MKHTLRYMIAIICTFGVLGFLWYGLALQSQKEEVTSEASLTVVSTIFPIHSLVSTIGGEYVDAQLILAPGESPHTFEPTPQDVQSMTGADMLFTIGLGIDDWTHDMAEAAGVKHIISFDTVVSLRERTEEDIHDDHDAEEEEHDHDHDHEGLYDPHYWLSPDNAKKMAEKIMLTFVSADPEHSQLYEEHYEAFLEDLAVKEDLWQAQFASIQNMPILTFHNAWQYFAAYGGITIAGSVEPFPGKEPTPQYLLDLQQEVDEQHVTAIFTEPQLSSELIKSFLSDTGIKYGILDPIGGRDGKDSYIALIDYNVTTLVDTLVK